MKYKITKSFYLVIFLLSINISPLFLLAQGRKLVLLKSFPDLESEKEGNFLATPYDFVFYKGTYIASDAKEGCLKVFSSEGELIRIIGSGGYGPGELSDPFVLTVDERNGIIYCSDQGNSRISCFLTNSEFLKTIKTSLNIHDLEFIEDHIYAAAYSEANQSLFFLIDKDGRIQNFFGDFFDEKINRLPLNYRRVLYGEVCLGVKDDNLYVFFERLPYIQIYNKKGQLQRTIYVKIKEVKKVYEKNLKAPNSLKKQGGRMGITKWLFGACVSDDKFYCYSPNQIGTMLVIDLNGNLVEKIPFEENLSKGMLIRKRFINKIGKNFYFIDFENSQINIYQEFNAS